MCPVASKAPSLKWFGVAIDGKRVLCHG
jgi:hypothetical protein